jgi:hypothetical protein
VHYIWKVAEKGFKMAFMMNKFAMINSCEIIHEIFFAKNHCEIQVRTVLVCALHLIKYGIFKFCLFLTTPMFSRHLWQPNTAVVQHRCLIRCVLLKMAIFTVFTAENLSKMTRICKNANPYEFCFCSIDHLSNLCSVPRL